MQCSASLSDPWISYVLGPDVPRQKTIGRSTFKGRDFERIDGVRFELNYVGGDSAIGFVGRSPIGFGGLTLEKQTVNVATDVRYSAIMDGLVGLGTGKGIAGMFRLSRSISARC